MIVIIIIAFAFGLQNRRICYVTDITKISTNRIRSHFVMQNEFADTCLSPIFFITSRLFS